ncbi:MAG: sigma-70 family RNA polymerase sigma factor [Planctomycetota bacterium]|nr:sigma-70 family RNA polymerase sigma factor [Planctomycetota bacterium]
MSGGSSFLTTRWSLVARAASAQEPEARGALEELSKTYWWPLYAYLRRRGIDGERAADLVQGLFAELIEKGRLAQADGDRGRFRGWLLAALKYHVSHEDERERSAKRGGRARHVPLDPADADRRWQLASAGELDPERTFERAWALSVLDAALVRLERRMEREGKTKLFAALKPFLAAETDAANLRSIAESLGSTEGAVKVAAHRLRQAWREEIRAEIASTLDDVRDLDDEVRGLFAALAP